jgi:hypothetical protein
VFTAGYVDAKLVDHVAVLPDGVRVSVPHAAATQSLQPVAESSVDEPTSTGSTRRVPLGTVAGARSGDKGGSANIGVWARDEAAWPWLVSALTVERLHELLPETAELKIERYVLPNLRAVNFVIDGLLGQGVAFGARFDPQAKALGEWLRSRYVDIAEELL